MSRYKPKGFFITGTDTDIGKTYISKLLVDNFSKRQQVSYMKPVQTGCVMDENKVLQAPDLDFVLSDKSMMTKGIELHVPYRFAPACSPHLAAMLESKIISLDHIRDCLQKVSNNSILTIVEGAGGVLAPLSETTFMVDLILHLQLPVILVTSPHLGTLNHTFLTLKLLHHAGAMLGGIVINNCRNVAIDFLYHDNIRMILEHTRPVPILEVPYGENDEQRITEFCNKLQTFI